MDEQLIQRAVGLDSLLFEVCESSNLHPPAPKSRRPLRAIAEPSTAQTRR